MEEIKGLEKLTKKQQSMVSRTIPVAKFIAGKYYNKKDEELYGYTYDDLFSECCMKLIECALLYDKTKEAQFVTFAYASMSNKMKDMMRRKKYLCSDLEAYSFITDGNYSPISMKQTKNGQRRRTLLGISVYPAYFDNYFQNINLEKLTYYCDEIDENLPNLPAKAFDMIYPKIIDKNIKNTEIATSLNMEVRQYNNAMNRIRQWLRNKHIDIAIIEDCCD